MNPELFKNLAEQTLEANRVRMEMFNGKVWAHLNRTWPIPLLPCKPMTRQSNLYANHTSVPEPDPVYTPCPHHT